MPLKASESAPQSYFEQAVPEVLSGSLKSWITKQYTAFMALKITSKSSGC